MPASTNAPLPVQQRAWETRERILGAAVTCLAEDGYAAATTSRIQARSGVSRGSLLHQFPSREDLLIAAVQHLAAARTATLDAPPFERGDVDASIDALWNSHHGTLFAATLELWVAAKNHPDLATALAPREHELGRAIRGAVAEMFGPEIAGRPWFGDFVSVLLTSLRGAALTYTFAAREHTVDPLLGVWKRLARLYLASDPGLA
ncbi:TetR/AcrR family transcriptional regulator [Actinomycetospora termitidis]|uniref:TetR/AcrR family transcriptional regulator n=1 Tax=Actinomycetospora termitidis TaxID=3053470 RepID=A0ABT7MEK6_9PSEU|nr:TetR/AcrR family transcriptional regulator [Actinomycetospora sp. Odt1-22]MDL5158327.1 TetR/AcrR family transcriptional regulator [Actinomycetospora sp. Odt1-22]